MKKLVLILLIFSAAVALAACGRKGNGALEGITSPSDIYSPPASGNPNIPSSDTSSAASPSDIIPAGDGEITEESGIMPFYYKALYEPESHQYDTMKSWISSINGLPGFTASGVFDPTLGNYVITGGMGGSEAIDYIEVTERGFKVVFRADIPMGPTMKNTPGGVMVNSYKEEVIGGDGQKYTSTMHKYYINDGALFQIDDDVPDYLIFSFEKPIAEPISDFFIYWGAVD